MTERGAFIVFEGIDRSGKTTQSRLLVQKLQAFGLSVKQIRFPNYETASGQILQSYLKNKVDMDARTAHLLFAANRSECVADITKSLSDGFTVVCDRYVLSGAAYSVAKGLAADWCFDVERGLPKPDVVMLMCVDPTVVEKRSEFGGERHDKTEFLNKVQNAYQQIKSRTHTVEIDASLSIDEVARLVDSAVEAKTTNEIDYF